MTHLNITVCVLVLLHSWCSHAVLTWHWGSRGAISFRYHPPPFPLRNPERVFSVLNWDPLFWLFIPGEGTSFRELYTVQPKNTSESHHWKSSLYCLFSVTLKWRELLTFFLPKISLSFNSRQISWGEGLETKWKNIVWKFLHVIFFEIIPLIGKNSQPRFS